MKRLLTVAIGVAMFGLSCGASRGDHVTVHVRVKDGSPRVTLRDRMRAFREATPSQPAPTPAIPTTLAATVPSVPAPMPIVGRQSRVKVDVTK